MPEPLILIVDDDRNITHGVGLRLRAAGYETLTATDGAEGVAMAIDRQPDAILMDVRMPTMNGLDALEALRAAEQTSQIPVIMLSASLRDRDTALEAGAQYFLTKPYRSNDLLAAIRAVLQNVTTIQGDIIMN